MMKSPALSGVNYDTLVLNKQEKTPVCSVPSRCSMTLLERCCRELIKHGPLVDLAAEVLPAHLVPVLLKTAMDHTEHQAISSIIASWPFKSLCFRSILPLEQKALFEESMGFDLYVFKGILRRTKACKMACLDFSGFELNDTFAKLIIQMWPILSLKKSQLKPKKLSKVIMKAAHITGDSVARIMNVIMPQILKDLLGHEMVKSSDFSINMPPGEKLVVKLDNVYFTTNNFFFMDYFICNCLRSVTPVYVDVANIYMRSESSFRNPDEIIAPFIVFCGQSEEILEGVSLHHLDEGVFLRISQELRKFTRLRALDIQDCNIYLQEGITRRRTSVRLQMINTLACFSSLVRLDIGFNYLLGCLGELLDALVCPLEYLSVCGCDLNEKDLENLVQSKHAQSLRELNLGKLCQYSVYTVDRISPNYLIGITKHFTNLVALRLQRNNLPNSVIPGLCDILTNHLIRLKGLDISRNIFSDVSHMQLVRACAQMKTIQKLRLTCFHSLAEEILNPGNHVNMQQQLMQLLNTLGRPDIKLDLVRFSFAIMIED
ncbi:hypothetical protein ScPMuIL_007924 [Solemya velum]